MTVAPAQLSGDPRVTARRRSGAVWRFIALGAVGVAALLASATLLELPALATAVAGGVLTAAVIVFALLLYRSHPHARLGAANAITLLRLTIVAVLLSMLLAGGGNAALVIAVSAVALSLDGVDGSLARRQRLESPFGASFDMEVDSAFALVLAALASFGPAGPIALILGLPRYLFGVAGWALPWLNGQLSARFSRKVACVVQLIALIVLQLPVLSVWFAVALVLATVALLAWSFGIDIVHLFRSRARSGV